MGKLRQNLIRIASPRSLDHVKLLVLREGRSGLREYSISGTGLYRFGLSLLFILPIVFFLGAQLLLETAHSSRVAMLRNDNAELAAQLSEFEEKILELERNMATLSTLDKDLRIHANIPPIPGEIRQIGTGGGIIEMVNDVDYLVPTEDVSVRDLSNRIDNLFRGLKLEQISYEGIKDSLKNDLARLKNTPSIRPMKLGAFTSSYGLRRDPYNRKKKQQHRGLDISVREGTRVRATAAGRVSATRFDRNLGLYVKIDHGNGFHTLYGHLREIEIVQGQQIKRGEWIGRSGNTGRSTAPHLHYEVRHYNQAQNPFNYF